MEKIEFISNRPWLNDNSISKPSPSVKNIPDWYINYDRYYKINDNDYAIGPDGGKVLTWKSCPAMYDIIGSGYLLKTPCDIDFYEQNGQIMHGISDPMYREFVSYRDFMPGFPVPPGFRPQHFAWFPDWAPKVPDGYSVLYTSPLNRFDLPFISTSGVIDNDIVDSPGTIPFFIANGWTGRIQAGTPYMQLFPFKREDWESSYTFSDYESIVCKHRETSQKYRVPDGGVYLNEVWHRRKYK